MQPQSPPNALPTWEGFLAPALHVLNDGETRQVRAIYERVADEVALTESQRLETINSGQARFENRIGWALSSLARHGALERPRRGSYRITEAGRNALQKNPQSLLEADLEPTAQTLPQGRPPSAGLPTVTFDSPLDPLEQIDVGVARLRAEVAAQLLEKLRCARPEFLEQSVLDVLVAMGYGGVEQRARRIGGSGDGGVDGVIDQDALGLARIYVQAKRYNSGNVVGRPEVQAFVGALHGRQASQGIFITTSSFTQDALRYAEMVPASIVLINGERLAQHMVSYGIGVDTVETYSIVRVDDDYFEDKLTT